MLKEQLYNIGEVQINYAVGCTNGLPLLLLHGVMSSWQSFLPLISGLCETYQIFAMDLRGHGLSGKVKRGYRLVDYSADVLHFVQDKLRGSTIILGHSFGALIALYVAAKLPHYIRTIILLDPPFLYRTMALKDSPWVVDREAYHWFATVYDLMTSIKSVNEIGNHLVRMFPHWPTEGCYILAQRLSQMDPDVLEMVIKHQHMESYNTDELLEQVICPVLVFQGNRSRGAALTDDDAKYLLKNLGQCIVIHMDGAGHNIHETHSKEIVESATSFLAAMIGSHSSLKP
jgi:pimeloyl-ACP methyl ester carboxylesterase